jgi:hypothetical protein
MTVKDLRNKIRVKCPKCAVENPNGSSIPSLFMMEKGGIKLLGCKDTLRFDSFGNDFNDWIVTNEFPSDAEWGAVEKDIKHATL